MDVDDKFKFSDKQIIKYISNREIIDIVYKRFLGMTHKSAIMGLILILHNKPKLHLNDFFAGKAYFLNRNRGKFDKERNLKNDIYVLLRYDIKKYIEEKGE